MLSHLFHIAIITWLMSKRTATNCMKANVKSFYFPIVLRVGQYTVIFLLYFLGCLYIFLIKIISNVSGRSLNLSQKVKISGFVDIVDDTIMISDAKTAKVLPI